MPALKVFSLNAGAEFARKVATNLGVSLASHEEREFVDGEHKVRPLDDVEDADVYLVQSLHSDSSSDPASGTSVDDKLVRVLFFVGALKDAGAARVTVVAPYLCYARKDRRTKLHDPLSSRYLASLLESIGTDCVVTLDVHNLAAFENAFRVRTLHLPAQPLFVDFVAHQLKGDHHSLVVASPDVGGVKRAEAFRQALGERLGHEVGRAFVEKYRSAGVLSGGTLVGEVKGANVIIVDDLIAGGGTICRATEAFSRGGAARIFALASHGQFCGQALADLAQLPIEAIAVTNSLPQQAGAQLHVVDCALLLADAIKRLHTGGPATRLTL